MTLDPNHDRRHAAQRRRGEALVYLRKAGITFEQKNGGAHLIVRGRGVVVDYWPGQDHGIVRGSGRSVSGVRDLAQMIKTSEQEHAA